MTTEKDKKVLIDPFTHPGDVETQADQFALEDPTFPEEQLPRDEDFPDWFQRLFSTPAQPEPKS